MFYVESVRVVNGERLKTRQSCDETELAGVMLGLRECERGVLVGEPQVSMLHEEER